MTSPIRAVKAPKIREIVLGLDLDRVTNDAIKALAGDDEFPGDDALFQRAGMLVHVVRNAEPPKREGKVLRKQDGAPVIRALPHATLRERLSVCGVWKRLKAGEWKACLPPENILTAVHARGEWGGIRPLVGITTTPTMRSDGSIFQTPGYDKNGDTGLLYWPNAPYPPVPDEPSQEDARLAYEALSEVVCDFPFAEPHHRAAWIASVLSLIARSAIPGPVPLFAIEANTRGSGKSKLADAAVRIATGHDAARTSVPETDDEMRKRITSLVLEGDASVCLDNIVGPLGGPSLDAALTGTTWKDRALGSNATVAAPLRIVWFATGQNLQLAGDLGRRAMMIRLESPLENPEDREGFKHADLMAWIDEKRHHLVVWGLTILRGYVVADRPRLVKQWGSFEAWSGLIPNAIAWASGVDPMGARASSDPMNDSARDAIDAVLVAIEVIGNGKEITTKTLIDALYPFRGHDEQNVPDAHPCYDAARDAIEEATRTQSGKVPDKKRVGKYFASIRTRIVNGRRLERGPTAQGKGLWRSVKA